MDKMTSDAILGGMKRPDFIKHYSELQDKEPGHYPASDEPHGFRARLGKSAGLQRIGINHHLLPPGQRSSYPHAEGDEEEFVYVIEGKPDVWIDGHLYALVPGDAVGFPAGTGICHTFINNSDSDVRLLVIGEASKDGNRIFYPLNPSRKAQVGNEWWDDVPQRPMGPHDGLPDQRRK
jgi:protein CrcB